ncbi:hypothetical protein BMS3Bbin04_00769 [bacterium BMS3Bbin04]|nr:hypothetical protein BMS3Bbin04_00769 [bacterium BMS3Bbin04]
MDSLNLVMAGIVDEKLSIVVEDLRREGYDVRTIQDPSVDPGPDVDAVLIAIHPGKMPDLADHSLFRKYTSPRVLLLTDDELLGELNPVSMGAQAMVFPPFHSMAVINAIQTAIRIHTQHAVLEESLAHYVESHRHLGEGILLTDSSGIVRFANDLAKHLLGLDDSSMHGKLVGDVFPVIDLEEGNPLKQLPDLSNASGQLIKASRATIRGGGGEAREVLFQVKTVGDVERPDGMMLIFHEYRLRQKPKQVVTLKERDGASPVRAAEPEVKRRTVRIQTFGEFQISIDDELIEVHRWRSKKALDALCLLLHSYGKPVQKDILIDFLWPETDATTGNRRLLNVISELRKYLEPGARRYARNNFIRHESGMYRLSFEDNVYLDAALFRDLVRQGDYHWGVGELRMGRTYYQEALQHKCGAFMPRYMNSPIIDEAREYFDDTEERVRERLRFDKK